MATSYDFIMDPAGDVILTLSNANASFAVWKDPKSTEADAPPTTDNNTGLLPKSEPEPLELAIEPEPIQTMTFLLSSRHLSLASPVFKTMLSGPWAEGTKRDADDLFWLSAEGWDSEALSVVMNVVHGRWALVPTEVSLDKLARIAAIVDYYDIREALQLILSMWMKDMAASSVPKTLCRETFLWILIARVFNNQAIFKQATKIAVALSSATVELPDNIPIPSSIVDRINARRLELMNTVTNEIRNVGQGYIEGRAGYGCKFECASMQLGILIKTLKGMTFADNDFQSLRLGDMSLVEVMSQLEEIKLPNWGGFFTLCQCHGRNTRNGYYYSCHGSAQHACDMQPWIYHAKGINLGVNETFVKFSGHDSSGVDKINGMVALELD